MTLDQQAVLYLQAYDEAPSLHMKELVLVRKIGSMASSLAMDSERFAAMAAAATHEYVRMQILLEQQEARKDLTKAVYAERERIRQMLIRTAEGL